VVPIPARREPEVLAHRRGGVDVREVITRYVDPEELAHWLPPTLHVKDEQAVSVDVRDDVLVAVAEHLDGVVLVVEPTAEDPVPGHLGGQPMDPCLHRWESQGLASAPRT
jgi:hypothetical protein